MSGTFLKRTAPVLAGAALVLGMTTPAAQSAQPAEVGAPAAARAKPATVKFTHGRHYVVKARIGKRTVKGHGVMPRGFVKKRVKAYAPSNTLGSKRREVLVKYGRARNDVFTTGYAIFTHRKKKALKNVRIHGFGYLTTSGDGGYVWGFGCSPSRRLVAWTYDAYSDSGTKDIYRLKGKRLRKVATRTTTSIPSRGPGSCK